MTAATIVVVVICVRRIVLVPRRVLVGGVVLLLNLSTLRLPQVVFRDELVLDVGHLPEEVVPVIVGQRNPVVRQLLVRLVDVNLWLPEEEEILLLRRQLAVVVVVLHVDHLLGQQDQHLAQRELLGQLLALLLRVGDARKVGFILVGFLQCRLLLQNTALQLCRVFRNLQLLVQKLLA